MSTGSMPYRSNSWSPISWSTARRSSALICCQASWMSWSMGTSPATSWMVQPMSHLPPVPSLLGAHLLPGVLDVLAHGHVPGALIAREADVAHAAGPVAAGRAAIGRTGVGLGGDILLRGVLLRGLRRALQQVQGVAPDRCHLR